MAGLVAAQGSFDLRQVGEAPDVAGPPMRNEAFSKNRSTLGLVHGERPRFGHRDSTCCRRLPRQPGTAPRKIVRGPARSSGAHDIGHLGEVVSCPVEQVPDVLQGRRNQVPVVASRSRSWSHAVHRPVCSAMKLDTTASSRLRRLRNTTWRSWA